MPPKKNQRTGENSAAATQEYEDEQQDEQPEAESSAAQETVDNDESSDDDGPPLRDTEKIPNGEYIGMHRPHFDYDVENRTLGEDSKEDEDFVTGTRLVSKLNEAGVMFEPTKDHPNHKWIMMWEGYKIFMDYRRRSRYCCPDLFSMYIYDDFEIIEFDDSLKQIDENVLKHTWAIVSAIVRWINELEQGPLVDHLKADTDFPDIPIVITSLLEFSDGLPNYGIEGDAVKWRPHAAAYFKKGKFAHKRGISNTEKILETAKGGSEAKLAKKTDKDP